MQTIKQCWCSTCATANAALQPQPSPAASAQQQLHKCYAGPKAKISAMALSKQATHHDSVQLGTISIQPSALTVQHQCQHASVMGCIQQHHHLDTLNRKNRGTLSLCIDEPRSAVTLTHSNSAIREPGVLSPTVEGRTGYLQQAGVLCQH